MHSNHPEELTASASIGWVEGKADFGSRVWQQTRGPNKMCSGVVFLSERETSRKRCSNSCGKSQIHRE